MTISLLTAYARSDTTCSRAGNCVFKKHAATWISRCGRCATAESRCCCLISDPFISAKDVDGLLLVEPV